MVTSTTCHVASSLLVVSQQSSTNDAPEQPFGRAAGALSRFESTSMCLFDQDDTPLPSTATCTFMDATTTRVSCELKVGDSYSTRFCSIWDCDHRRFWILPSKPSSSALPLEGVATGRFDNFGSTIVAQKVEEENPALVQNQSQLRVGLDPAITG